MVLAAILCPTLLDTTKASIFLCFVNYMAANNLYGYILTLQTVVSTFVIVRLVGTD